MKTLTPKTAMEALRLAKTFEAATKLEAVMFWNGNGTCTLDSWKTDENGKRVRRSYEVDLNAWTCTCADFQGRGQYCKHLLHAREVALEEEYITMMEDRLDGEEFMQNLHTERSIR
ncbi:MAG: hypothetical protein JWN14_23 [Chthonomonadales bacterium]|nr:hypothetical protein [Chthonomonadales bacterium]